MLIDAFKGMNFVRVHAIFLDESIFFKGLSSAEVDPDGHTISRQEQARNGKKPKEITKCRQEDYIYRLKTSRKFYLEFINKKIFDWSFHVGNYIAVCRQ